MAKQYQKPDPFCDSVLGEWKSDKKRTNKDVLAFSRTAELHVPEQHAQDWIDPVTFDKKKLHGKVRLTEVKLINKHNSELSFNRIIEPALKGAVIDKVIP
jgi:hypothetical protein